MELTREKIAKYTVPSGGVVIDGDIYSTKFIIDRLLSQLTTITADLTETEGAVDDLMTLNDTLTGKREEDLERIAYLETHEYNERQRAEKAEAKVERLRDDACRFYYADGSSVVLSKEETLKKRIKAAGQISRLIEALKEIEELSNCRWSIEKASAALNHKEG